MEFRYEGLGAYKKFQTFKIGDGILVWGGWFPGFIFQIHEYSLLIVHKEICIVTYKKNEICIVALYLNIY